MANSPDRPRLVLIAGPTASGKSALATAVARRHDGVVINADSTQVYRDLRILSARPTAAEEALVPHRLFGHIDGACAYSAAAWARDATVAIDDAHRSGKLPVLVGGTGLYLRTLMDGIAPVPEIDPAVRDRIRAMPVTESYAYLRVEDPASAARLRPTDTTRIARALEVVRATGKTLGDWQASRTGGIGDRTTAAALILLPPREWLVDRCDRRLAEMFDGGAVDEVRDLVARDDLPADAPVRRAIGVTEIAEWQASRTQREEALAAARFATRKYAKRQYTWFRNQPPADWHRTSETDSCTRLAMIESLLRRS